MLRGAIVGFGNVAQFGHWPAYRANRDVEIVAVVDPSEQRRFAARQHSLCAFESLEDISEGAIDFVDICTPPARHAEPMRLAIERGCHVLCEKPFLLDAAAIDEIRMFAAEHRVAVMPVHNWKYAPIVRATTQLLRDGAIGEVRELEITTLRTHDAAVADASQPSWRRDAAVAGGGILMDHGWHALYLALHWLGGTPRITNAELHRSKTDAVEDEAMVQLEFPSGTARIELSWKANVRSNRICLRGARGEIVLDDDTLRVNGESTSFQPGLSAGSHHADWFAAMLPDVIAAFHDPACAQDSFEEAAICLTTIQRCYAVARASSGTSVSSKIPSASSRSARV